MSSNSVPQPSASSEIDDHKLLKMVDLVVHHRNLPELFVAMAGQLSDVPEDEIINFSLYDPRRNVMRLHVLEGNDLARPPIEIPVVDSPSGIAWQTQQPQVVPDVNAETRFPSVLNLLRNKGIRSYCTLPLTTAGKRLGALGLGSPRVSAYREESLRSLRKVTELVALAVENALTREALQQETERLQVLLEVNATLMINRDLEKLFPEISRFLRRVIGHDYASVAVYDKAAKALSLYPLDSPLTQGLLGMDRTFPVKETPAGQALVEGKTKAFSREDLLAMQSSFVSQMLEQGIQSLCCIPLVTHNGSLGTLNLASKEHSAFIGEDIDFLEQMAAQVAVALDNARAYREIAKLKDKLTKEKLYLEDEIRSERNFEEIVGESAALKRVLNEARTVAPNDATVLILGETGTGKELIARAIHRMSSRKNANFIKLNCAAIPAGLLESELFGHEKGAFTGAVSQKIGRLELADKGTLFLDEVGEIPLEMQPKLLRVLQDQEFERLGSTRTIRVNIRLIAATNRDLAQSLASRQFRSDLYYRLSVFPIRMPALQERKEDIPLLVRYFVQDFARRMKKQIETVPAETMNALVNWTWPGNVRELENIIERSVILSQGPILTVPLGELSLSPQDSFNDGTLESLRRESMVRVLRETGGVLSGPGGAAARLGLKRTTLQSRMQKLGISREEYENQQCNKEHEN
ncbi:MAG TPA: sigma 54-interacting transcriptional regulator [Candidatus Acidoferrales bacterium]|nr:sigma 54-interacting transcriptional regulator [Candidatus Acidoferrales bacterium]